MQIMEDVIQFLLDISNEVDITYNMNLKNLLAITCNNDKYEIIIKV